MTAREEKNGAILGAGTTLLIRDAATSAAFGRNQIKIMPTDGSTNVDAEILLAKGQLNGTFFDPVAGIGQSGKKLDLPIRSPPASD